LGSLALFVRCVGVSRISRAGTRTPAGPSTYTLRDPGKGPRVDGSGTAWFFSGILFIVRS